MSNDVVIDLPFPPSVNAIWRWVGTRMVPSSTYKAWMKEADKVMMMQRVYARFAGKVPGHFRYEVTLDAKERSHGRDGDNFSSKAILDILQSREIILDDKLADGGSWQWGEAPHGARVVLRAVA